MQAYGQTNVDLSGNDISANLALPRLNPMTPSYIMPAAGIQPPKLPDAAPGRAATPAPMQNLSPAPASQAIPNLKATSAQNAEWAKSAVARLLKKK